MAKRSELNLRDLGGIDDVIPQGLFLRSGKLSILTPTECAELCKRYNIITHETGSDPMTIIRNLRKHPEKLKEMIPDFTALYTDIVTDGYSRGHLNQVVETLRANADKGITTLFHCTAGKDRTGIASMALLKSYGVGDKEIIRDYMRTNRNAFWTTIKKCIGIALLTRNWSLVKTAYKAFMADRKLIVTAIENYG